MSLSLVPSLLRVWLPVEFCSYCGLPDGSARAGRCCGAELRQEGSDGTDELLRLIELWRVRARGTRQLDTESCGEPSSGLTGKRCARLADEHLNRCGNGGKGGVVWAVRLDLPISTPNSVSPFPFIRSRSPGSRFSQLGSPAAKRMKLSTAARGPPAFMPCSTTAPTAAWVSSGLSSTEINGGSVENRSSYRCRMADHQVERDDRAIAVAEHSGRSKLKSSQQSRHIVGLLVGRGCLPPCRR